ncbi:AMP-binding protein [Boudabousia marimammalium]|uniref:Long-chain fatty acid--CoA ligase n=1 Tax=Boudabousia marimammalium TaxID=156892 RepID=A0A1Q5PNV4_9ACTO|nr:AMP-binding protein [Boudabousia marimammalium]OKL49254.1 hypothetical protein BM477_04505 [Boudabousia marimammalium]
MVNALTKNLRKEYAANVRSEIVVSDNTLWDLLETTAHYYPDRVACDFLGATLTYHQLEDQARRAAQVFVNAGVKPGDRIGFIMPNCTQHIVAFYGAALAGAVVAEHNPLAPAGELEEQIIRHGAKVLVVWEKSFDQIVETAAKHKIKVMTVNLTLAMKTLPRLLLSTPLPATKAARAKIRPAIPVPASVPSFEKLVLFAKPRAGKAPTKQEDTAILLHTGGTTGTPKAVELTHFNLVANVEQAQAWVPNLHEGAEVFAAALPFFHAFGLTLSLTSAVSLAATILIFPTFDEDMVLSAQQRRPITFFPGVAPMFKRLHAKAKEQQIDLSSIRYTLSGAMALDGMIARNWETLTGGLIIEGYGMTEGGPILLGNPLSEKRHAGALGLPFPSTEVRIADPEDLSKDVPLGERGEILCRGPQVFKGYLNNPEETANTKWKDWLRTGDIGYFDPERKTIVMADRAKEMIISGGFNVYPSQVENIVRMMPGIEDVAVVGVPNATSGEKIVAAIVLDGTARVDLDELYKWAEKKLSHYAMPRQLEIVEELPRSQVGKVLRRVVREQLLAAQEGVSKLGEQTADTFKEWGGQAKAVADQLFTEGSKSETDDKSSSDGE